MTVTCDHLAPASAATARGDGGEDCPRIGGVRVRLRIKVCGPDPM
jgi:hypothetical protein